MGNKNIKVLVVDDEADFRQLLVFWLQSKGYSVIAATDGSVAIETIKKESPDIVFMDLRMPVMDGIEAIKNIRAFNQDIPIIIISAYIDDTKARTAFSYGISGVFYKDKDFEEGLYLLESALRTHKKLKDK